jgi:hypothetical protein
MPGIPREVAEHELCIKWGSKPVQQRLRYFDDEMRKAIGKEIANLLVSLRLACQSRPCKKEEWEMENVC